MKLVAATFAALSFAAPAAAEETRARKSVAPPDVQSITPGLAGYTDNVLFGDLWLRPDLAPRDRSLVTVAALIAGGHTAQMTGHFNRALDNGVKPGEIAGVITHLAFYAGWPNAISSVSVAKQVFDKRGLDTKHLADAADAKLPYDEARDAPRAATVRERMGASAPALTDYTNEILFRDVWQRADLSPRDRSLVTIASLIASGQSEQVGFHVNLGMDNGLTRTELVETATHLAFYAGWPRAMSAVPVVTAAAEKRASTDTSPASSGAATLTILRKGEAPPAAGPVEYFTGKVEVEQRFQRENPARIGGGLVSFDAGAHTAWHTHPLGQTLIITKGCGLAQIARGPVQELKTGDIVWIPPGVRHWHGASPQTAMTHVAIAEALDGKAVEWMEKLTEAEYAKGPETALGC
jgi:4-carboxymuconolactone decarboxylase